MPIHMFQFQLESSHMLTPNVKQFVMVNTEQPNFEYLPGQFITVNFEHQGKILRRSYSIANPPNDPNRIEFAASYVESGPGTEFLFNLKAGDPIQVTGPFGRLILKEEPPKRYIFVATSTGVTPYRSMIPSLKQRLEHDSNVSVVILEGVQKHEDLLYEQEFLTWAKMSPQVTFKAFLSREQYSGDHIYQGYVQQGFSDLNLNPAEDCIYLCGNPAMIDDAFALLKDQGFSSQQIIREKYISSK